MFACQICKVDMLQSILKYN